MPGYVVGGQDLWLVARYAAGAGFIAIFCFDLLHLSPRKTTDLLGNSNTA
jgi:hypothetical protein